MANLGTVFVELALDDRIYRERLSQVKDGAVATAKGVETAWKALGTSSEAVFNSKKVAAQNAYKLIRESALSTTQDITRAHEAMTAKIKQLNQQQAGVHQETNKSLSDQAAAWGLVASKAFIAYQAVHAITTVFKAGFNAVEDYRTAVASLASTIATFSQQGKTDMAGAYKEAYKYAGLLVEKIEEWDAKTVLTGKQLTSMVETLAQGGVLVDANNKKHEEGIIAIANAIALLTKGQNVEVQMRQEIRGLLDGEAKATNRLAQILEQAVGGNLKEHVELWKQEGTLIENAGKLLSGFAEGAKDLENTWGAVSSTIETITNRLLRDAFKPIYEDIVKLAKEYTLEVMKGGAGLDAAKNTLENGIYKSWLSIKNLVDGIYRVIWPLIEAEKLVLGIAMKILDQLGQVVSVFAVLAKRIGLVFQGELRAAFSGGILNELRAGLSKYGREAEKEIAHLDSIFGGSRSGGGPPKMAPGAGGKGGGGASQAAKDVDAMRRALEELAVMVGKTESELSGKLAAIEKRYADMKEKLKGNTEALVTLEQWKADAIAKLYAQEDAETQKHFENASANYDKAVEGMMREIAAGEKLFESKRVMLGLFTETEQAIMAEDEAIRQLMMDIEDGFNASKASVEDFYDSFGGLLQGFKDGMNEMAGSARNFHDVGIETWKDFHQAVGSFINDTVNQFIRGEEAKMDIQKAAGDAMAGLAGEISQKMYSAAIEKIISLLGALIGEAAGASGASGALKGGAIGALAEIGVFLGSGIAAMLAGRGMAQAFRAEGGWVGSHPGGGWISGGSGVHDDVYLGATTGVRHWGMGGEFVVNKSAAQKHAGLLRAINADKGYAGGGPTDVPKGPINADWEPLADMFVMGTLASALHGFMKGFIPGAIAEAIMFNVSAIGGAFGSKILSEQFGHAQGGFIDRGYFLGGLLDWINPFNNPVSRGLGLPNPSDVLPGWLPEPGRALDSLDPEKFLEMLKRIIREPYKQVAKDLLTPGINWSSPIDGISSQINLLSEVFKTSLGFKHNGGVFMPGEQLAVVQTGEGVVSHKGMDMLARINRGYAGGGQLEEMMALAQSGTDEQAGFLIDIIGALYGGRHATQASRTRQLSQMPDPFAKALQQWVWDLEDSANAAEALAKYQAEQAEQRAAVAEQQAALASQRRSMEIELLEAQGHSAEALSLRREDELAAMDASLRSLQQRIWATEDAKVAEEELTKAREEAAKQAEDQRQAARAVLDKQLGALKTSSFGTKVDYLRAFYFLTNQMVALGGGSDIPVPGFASGGYHAGGWRVVGERGPELEYTGPSRIYSGSQVQLAGGYEAVSKEEFFQLALALEANTRKTAKTLDKWDGEGQPSVRDDDAVLLA